ncbi:beta-N-acetylhexosaminidase, partial [Streptomyces sp. SID625]|nr:beta-N-acetylhexosaminidase [Streptomyces sp. SID625]
MDVIPQPGRATADEERFLELGPDTTVSAGEGTGRTERWLRTALGAATGLPLAPAPAGDDGTLRLRLDDTVARDLGPEGYRLTV